MQQSSRQFSKRLFSNAIYGKKVLSSKLISRFVHLGEYFTHGSIKEIELKTPVQVAARRYLPSSGTPGLPKYLSGPRENSPLFVKVKNGQNVSLKHWAKRSREVIDQAFKRYGEDRTAVAILFRGFPISNEADFSEWANNLGFEPVRYIGGTGPRNDIAENVAEGAHDDNRFTIEPHNEMAYSIHHPKIFTMCCFKPASWGGETAMCDNRQVLAQLDPNFVKECERREIRYWHFVPDKNSKQQGKLFQSWQMQFMTEDRLKVEAYLQENGCTYEWEDGSLIYWHNLPPFITHPISGERLWFNQVTPNHASNLASSPLYEGVKLPNKRYPFHVTYGDGEEIEQAIIDEHRRVTWNSAVGFQWKDGDVLFVDQLIVQHSRLGFEGDRKVGISLLKY